MRFQLLTVLVLLNGCVCFQPVDEFGGSGSNEPRDSGTRDSGSPVVEPITSFIAPVPLEDLAERESAFWRSSYLWEVGVGSPPWRAISWTANGELLIDAVGGIVLPDAGYISVATPSWRVASHNGTNSFPSWSRWNGEWYRFTYVGYVTINRFGPMQLWRLNRDTMQLESVLTVSSSFDAGTDQPFVDAYAVWGGTKLLIYDRVWTQHLVHTVGQLRFASDVSELTAPSRVIDDLGVPSADGIDGDDAFIWSFEANEQYVLRFYGAGVGKTIVDAGINCEPPALRTRAGITMGCTSDGGVDIWVSDRNGVRIVGRNNIAPEIADSADYAVRPFLAQVNPYRFMFVKDTDAGAMLTSCTSEHCVELFEVFSTPPNAGIDDAGALFIADYILDAGVRVTRVAPGHW